MGPSLKDMIISIIASTISGLIVQYVGSTIMPDEYPEEYIIGFVIVLAMLVGLCVYFFMFFLKCRSHGIIKILNSSVKGEGSTEAYMKRSNHSICFVGIAASKWVKNADQLERTIRSICSLNTGYIRFLLLNPNSAAAKKLTLAQQSQNDESVELKINKSLDKLSGIANRIANSDKNLLDKFEIRLYDQMPIYRLTVIDNIRAYFCFYQIGCDGSKLKQFVIKPKHTNDLGQQNIFNCMTEYFENLWSAKDTIRYDLIERKFIKGDECNAGATNQAPGK